MLDDEPDDPRPREWWGRWNTRRDVHGELWEGDPSLDRVEVMVELLEELRVFIADHASRKRREETDRQRIGRGGGPAPRIRIAPDLGSATMLLPTLKEYNTRVRARAEYHERHSAVIATIATRARVGIDIDTVPRLIAAGWGTCAFSMSRPRPETAWLVTACPKAINRELGAVLKASRSTGPASEAVLQVLSKNGPRSLAKKARERLNDLARLGWNLAVLRR